MILTLPDEPALASFEESELKLELAVALFSGGRVSRSVAAAIAGLDQEIKQKYPRIKRIFVEAEARRAMGGPALVSSLRKLT